MLSIEGTIISLKGKSRGRIEIDQKTGLITKVSEPKGEADIVLSDEYIFSGFIDLHVHAREDESHTQDYKEDFKTAGEAAINGGVVAFAEMPSFLAKYRWERSFSRSTSVTRFNFGNCCFCSIRAKVLIKVNYLYNVQQMLVYSKNFMYLCITIKLSNDNGYS